MTTNHPSTFSKKSFFSASLGTMIEYYDYALIAIFLPLIAPLFFPAHSTYDSLMKGYWVLLIAMIARPIGGLFFGYIGDSFGRRKALLASMTGIALTTLMTGLLPTYAAIGVAATLLIAFSKAIQVFCFGGEFNGAGIYVTEHTQQKNESLIGSCLMAITYLGALFASFIGVMVTLPWMPAWGWRIAFIFGGIVGLIGIFYRKNLLESPQFRSAKPDQENIYHLLKHHPKELFAGLFIGGFATVPFGTVMTFINPVLMSKGYFTNHTLMIIETLLTLVAIITIIPCGWLASKSSPLKMMSIASIALIVFCYPLLLMIDSGNFIILLFAMIIFIMINQLFLGPTHAFLKNLFKPQYRYRGSSLGFCLGMSLLGGLTPVIDGYLYKISGQFSVLACWLIFIGLGSLLTIRLAHQKITLSAYDHKVSMQAQSH